MFVRTLLTVNLHLNLHLINLILLKVFNIQPEEESTVGFFKSLQFEKSC